MNFLFRAIIHFLGGRFEWETQTTEPDGCWRTWTSGLASFDDAIKTVQQDIAAGKRWNQHMPLSRVKWRIERRIVWAKYYDIQKNP